jgi:LytR cell envelope-related transcriptional attenuator
VTVEVVNGSGVIGASTVVSNALRWGAGYDILVPSVADGIDETAVYARPGELAACEGVAEAMTRALGDDARHPVRVVESATGIRRFGSGGADCVVALAAAPSWLVAAGR